MRIDELHHLVIEEAEREHFNFRFNPSPNVSPKPQLPQRTLIIHAPARASVNDAVSEFGKKPPKEGLLGSSRHLILGKDGREIVQMVPFNTGALHAPGYNGRSIGIELQYPGELLKLTREVKAHEYILASGLANSRYGHWPLYPKAQLDSLLMIAAALLKKYPAEITDVVARDEILDGTHPGPAFPIIQLRERLIRQNLLRAAERSLVLQETSRSVRLISQPEKDSALLSESLVPPGTPVAVINEKHGWYLISVIEEVDGNPWLLGWVEKSAVRVKKDFTAVVTQDHFLTTSDGRRFQQVTPHPNGYDPNKRNPEPRFIIIHFTTGTKMESTISHFKNPSAGVSTHLLIGRDGRVVQFLPFDQIAHHCGFSWWERQSNLNKYSIGIELDNAGLLSKGAKGWMARKIVIPQENVGRAVHWKQFTPNNPSQFPAWEKFSQAQLDVALNVVKALIRRYPSITEILGHDDVNLLNRYDPGPLFPMKQWRQELFQREEPDIQIFTINRKTQLYANFDGRLPSPTRLHTPPNLPGDSKVIVMKPDVHWSLVKVNQSKERHLNGKIGWVRSNSLSAPLLPKGAGVKAGRKLDRKTKIVEKKKTQKADFVDRRTTRGTQQFYVRGANQPTPVLADGQFDEGTRVRIQQYRGEWTLVVVLDTVKGRSGWEGWIRTELLSPEVIP